MRAYSFRSKGKRGVQINPRNTNPDIALILHLCAPNMPSGNPNRLYVVMSVRGEVLSVIDEGYTGLPRSLGMYPIYQIAVPASEVRGWKEDYPSE